MKTDLFKKFLTGMSALGIAVCAHADFTNTFDSSPLSADWSGLGTWSAGPAGWPGGGCLQSTFTVGGWTANSPEFNAQGTGLTDIQNIITSGGSGHVTFDYIVDGTTFNANAQWYLLDMAGNSASGGWHQQDNVVSGWQNAGDTTLRSTNIDLTFAQMGWTNAADTWFQIFFIANSDAANPINFYIDNLAVHGASTVTTTLTITNFSYSTDTGFTVSGTGSPEGVPWRCLASSSLSVPRASWTQVGSGNLSGGVFTATDASATSSPGKFYVIVSP